jgi:myo-inositol-1-phosphate synthase
MRGAGLKIWIIGARGTTATTVVVGTLAARRGLAPLEGLLTETPAFQALPLPEIDSFFFGGCDMTEGALGETAHGSMAAVGVFAPSVVDALMEELKGVPVARGILRGGGRAVQALADATHPDEHAREAIQRVADELESFADGEATVVVNLASTEPVPDASILTWDVAALERALDADDSRIPASCLYAYAAIQAGMPYVNFTPSIGASIPALIEMARRAGVPLAGRDGKTGETLIKTALAPMFAIRALPVEGWYGTNILGNLDGRVLADPENRASKVTSKAGVLEACLGYAPEGDVRIDYFPPLADHKVAWNFIQFRGWGGHRMRMQFTWEGTDSALAAPLILDLARLIELARTRGEAGPVGALGLFFKVPEGSAEMNLHRQYDELLRWIRNEEDGQPLHDPVHDASLSRRRAP